MTLGIKYQYVSHKRLENKDRVLHQYKVNIRARNVIRYMITIVS